MQIAASRPLLLRQIAAFCFALNSPSFLAIIIFHFVFIVVTFPFPSAACTNNRRAGALGSTCACARSPLWVDLNMCCFSISENQRIGKQTIAINHPTTRFESAAACVRFAGPRCRAPLSSAGRALHTRVFRAIKRPIRATKSIRCSARVNGRPPICRPISA